MKRLLTVALLIATISSCKKNVENNISSILSSPNNLVAVLVKSNKATLTWYDSTNTEAGFKIERRIGNGSYKLFDSVVGNTRTYSDTTLLINNIYTYRVYSYNSSSSSSYSNEAFVNTYFSPTTTGSTWTYLMTSSDGKFNDSAFTFTATDSTTIIDNKTYNIFNSSVGDVYYAITDSGFYRTGSLLSTLLGLPQLATFEELYLKPNAVADSTTWGSNFVITYAGSPIPVTITYTIPSAGKSLTVLGKTYTNVVDVHLSSSASYLGLPITPATGDFYYAQGVGLISVNATVFNSATLSNVTTTFNLKSSSIK